MLPRKILNETVRRRCVDDGNAVNFLTLFNFRPGIIKLTSSSTGKNLAALAKTQAGREVSWPSDGYKRRVWQILLNYSCLHFARLWNMTGMRNL